MASPVRGLLFDLDGTLVDTEAYTDRAIEKIVARHGIEGFSLPPVETHGRTWPDVAATIRQRTGIRAGEGSDARTDPLAQELLVCWNELTAEVRPIPGAIEALRAAAMSGLKIAIVSSSPRAVIERHMAGLGVTQFVSACVGGDEVQRGKPDPEGFLKAARLLGVAPEESLVFEDSRAGLQAAREAGMRRLFILCVAADIEANMALATAATTDYRTLPPGFWTALADGTMDLAGGTFR